MGSVIVALDACLDETSGWNIFETWMLDLKPSAQERAKFELRFARLQSEIRAAESEYAKRKNLPERPTNTDTYALHVAIYMLQLCQTTFDDLDYMARNGQAQSPEHDVFTMAHVSNMQNSAFIELRRVRIQLTRLDKGEPDALTDAAHAGIDVLLSEVAYRDQKEIMASLDGINRNFQSIARELDT